MKTVSSTSFSLVAVLVVASSASARTEASPETKGAVPSEAVQRRAITVDGTGFHPSEISGKPGQKVSLVFRRTTDATCAKQVVFKDLGIRKELPLDQETEVTVTVGNAPIGFACGIDMLRGSIVAQ